MTRKLSYEHFHPYNLWTVDKDGSSFLDGTKCYITDLRTGDNYLNEDLSVIRIKCLLLSVGTPIFHLMAAIIKIVFNLLKLLSFYDFWKTVDDMNKENKANYNLIERASDAGVNVLNIIFAPIAILLLEFSALYGIFMPHDGRKLYASLEEFTYGEAVLAPCFQPEPDEHLLGGHIEQRNAY